MEDDDIEVLNDQNDKDEHSDREEDDVVEQEDQE